MKYSWQVRIGPYFNSTPRIKDFFSGDQSKNKYDATSIMENFQKTPKNKVNRSEKNLRLRKWKIGCGFEEIVGKLFCFERKRFTSSTTTNFK